MTKILCICFLPIAQVDLIKKKSKEELLVIYKKAVRGNIPAHILKSIREVLENE